MMWKVSQHHRNRHCSTCNELTPHWLDKDPSMLGLRTCYDLPCGHCWVPGPPLTGVELALALLMAD